MRQLPENWTWIALPDGYKLVRRDATTISTPYRDDEDDYTRDAVILVTDSVAGVVKGPGARQAWQTTNPIGVGIALAHAVNDWVDNENGDPHGGPELDARLAAAAKEVRA